MSNDSGLACLQAGTQKRILILNWRDIKHPLAGGAEISTHEHAKRWLEMGFDVIQFSSRVEGRSSEEIIDGVKIIRRGSHYTVHLFALFYYLKNLRNKIDLVIDEFHFIPFFTPLFVKTKIIAFIHETARELWFKNQPFPVNILGFLLEPIFFKLYKDVPFMTVSSSTEKDLVKFGISKKRIYLIQNGVITKNSKNLREKKPTVLYLGRLAKDKGIEDALLAFHDVQKVFKDASLWIVGREEKKGYTQNLIKLAKKLKINKSTTFFNYVSDEKKFDLLKQAWVLVHPSIKEGWGLTVIEAATQGTPTVAYNALGLCDSIVDGKTGLLTNDKTPSSLADKILTLFNDKILYNRLSKNAFLWSKKFNWKKSTEQSLKLIEEII